VKRPKWPAITWKCSRHEAGPRVLGINPPIFDFAAFNLWSRPVGLLCCLDMLARAGAGTALLDCLDQTWEDGAWPAPGPFGAGPYPKLPAEKPPSLANIPRRYSRYGLPAGDVRRALQSLDPVPDLVLVTCAMTYWYPGALEILRVAKSLWPSTPVVLGGAYATLCPDHARRLGFDLTVSGPLETAGNWTRLWGLLCAEEPELPAEAGFTPDLSWYPEPSFAPLLLSRGCPFSCPYCASNRLHPGFSTGLASTALRVAREERDKGALDFAFYDDALLALPEETLSRLLSGLEVLGPLRLHTPNALHVRFLSGPVCRRLKRAGLTTVRLGLETADFGARTDGKLTAGEWMAGVRNLLTAGFDPGRIGAYILFGLPGQDPDEVTRAAALVKRSGLRPHLALYSPIPGTALFDSACALSCYPLREEPLFHNSTLWPCHPGGFSWEGLRSLKERLSDAH
jgi:hypothetical protein